MSSGSRRFSPRLLGYGALAVALVGALVARARWETARQGLEHDRLGMARFQAGDLAAAARELREEIALTPGRALAHYNLGIIELQRGRHQAAREALSRAVALGVERPEANCALGLAAFRMSDYSAAVAPIKACLARNPEDDDARYLLAQSYLGQARLDEAEREFRALIARQPANARFLYALGTVYLFRPATPATNAEALGVLQRAVAAKDTPAGAYYSLGLVQRRAGHPGEAAAALEQAVKRDPRLLEARRTLGLAYRQLGRVQEAATQFRAARAEWDAARRDQRLGYLRDEVQRNPANPMTHFQLGCLYEELNDVAGARAEFETALQLDPNWPDARQRLLAVDQRAGQAAKSRAGAR